MSDTDSKAGLGGCLLLVGLVGWGVYSQVEEYRSKKAVAAQTVAQKAAAERAASEKAAAETVAKEKAIDLAKNASTLAQGMLFTSKPPKEVMTNDFQLRQMMSRLKGDMRIVGWEAKRYDDDTFVVTYSFEREGQRRAFPFEVKLSVGVVRGILGDAELETKYGWYGDAPGGGVR